MEKKRINISYYALSFIGRRKNNEDNCIAISISSDIHFLAVADGMGGMAAGEIASKLVIDVAIKYLTKAMNSNFSEHNLKRILHKIFQASQVAISNKIHNDKTLSGMGSTLSCVLIYKDKFIIGNLGDSRVYFYRNGQLKQITQDHNYITDFLKKEGKLPDRKQIQRFGHFITRAIDGGSDEPDIFPLHYDFYTLSFGDAFLICSDGLITDKSETDTKNLKEYLIGTESLEKAAQQMISDAYYSGSTDNISVVLGEVGKLKRKKSKLIYHPYPPNENESKEIAKTEDRKKFNIYNFAIVTIIILIFLLGYFLFINKPQHTSQNIQTSHPKGVLKKNLNRREIEWNPFDGQLIKNKLIIGKNEDLIWRKPNLEDDEISGYEVVIKAIGSNQTIFKKTLKTPSLSINKTNLKNGQYNLSISLILKNRQNLHRSVILSVKD